MSIFHFEANSICRDRPVFSLIEFTYGKRQHEKYRVIIKESFKNLLNQNGFQMLIIMMNFCRENIEVNLYDLCCQRFFAKICNLNSIHF